MPTGHLLRILCCLLLASLVSRASADTADCTSPVGAAVPDQAMCGWFRQFIPRGTRPVDPRIEDRFPTATADAPPIRSFAFVVSVSKYPNMEDPSHRDLAAVRTDLPNIISFLREQQFDEIIVLEDEQATNARIRMVFEKYLVPQMSIFGGRARFLFAFDGHGSHSADPTLPGGLALSTIAGENDSDPDNTFPLADLASRLQVVASLGYQSVALLGSCYSGGVFPRGNSDAQSYSYSLKPGAHVVASAKQNQFAWTLGGTQGTVFFDYFITAVRESQPQIYDQRLLVGSNQQAPSPNSAIVRLERAVLDVNERLEGTMNPVTHQPFPQIQIGAMAPAKNFEGAFFFLGSQSPVVVTASAEIPDPLKAAFPELIQLSTKTGKRTGSAIKDRPDVAVYNVPEAYKIRGVDVSQYNASVNYSLLKENDIQFIYARATVGAARQDSRFQQHRTHAQEAGLKVGAYHVFSFCQAADDQFANIEKTIPATDAALPLAIDLEWFGGKPGLAQEAACNDIPAIRQRLLQLSKRVTDHYKKKPVVYVNGSAAKELIDSRFNDYSLWLADYRKQPAASVQLDNVAPRPWTFWQFTSTAIIPGVSEKVDLNAFFGSQQQFDDFAAGKGNIALSASSPAPR